MGGVDEGDPRLRGWWAFDEPRGAVALDRSVHRSHAVLGEPNEPANPSAPTRVLRPSVTEREATQD